MTAEDIAAADPKGLIREALRIDGIGPGECRSIFLDWALQVPASRETQADIRLLLAWYDAEAPEHPMTAVLREGLGQGPRPTRRGGWRGRRS